MHALLSINSLLSVAKLRLLPFTR